MYRVEYGGGHKLRSKKFRRLWLAEEFARENGPAVVWLDQGRTAAPEDRHVIVRRFPAPHVHVGQVADPGPQEIETVPCSLLAAGAK